MRLVLIALIALIAHAQTRVLPEQIRNWTQFGKPGRVDLSQTRIPGKYWSAFMATVHGEPMMYRTGLPDSGWAIYNEMIRKTPSFRSPVHRAPIETWPDCDPPHRCGWAPKNCCCDCGVPKN